jgi:hypothetical protein
LQQTDALLDQLICAASQVKRHGYADSLGGLQVNDKLDLGCALDRQIDGLLAL